MDIRINAADAASRATTPDHDAEASPAASTIPLSVILTNYNHGKLIPRALRALLDQAPGAKEIIVVDDGSADDSVGVIEDFVRRHPSVRLIRHPVNRGIVEAAHTGMAAATGDYLMFAAADDYVLPDLFRRAHEVLTRYPGAALFCSNVALVDNANRVIGLRPVTQPVRDPGYLSPADVRREIRNTDFWFIGTSAVFRSRCIAATGYLEKELGSIGDTLVSRLLAFRHGFYFDPAVLAAYNKDPSSFSGRSALSAENSLRLLGAADAWIAANMPADIRDEQRRLFVRRMSFGFARLSVVWRNGRPNIAAISDILDCGRFDRAVLAALARIPALSGPLVLGWMTLRTRPFGAFALLEAYWRALKFKWGGAAEVQHKVDAANRPFR